MKTTCTLINKSSGRVGYTINDPDCSVRRILYPGQSMRGVSVTELEKLIQQPGGIVLFYNYLMIDDEEILHHLLPGAEAPEYWLTEDKIPGWMNSCSLDEFKDALDFAPIGTKDLIKKYAVSVPLKEYDKRQAMIDQLGFDVTAAIELSKTPEEKKEEAEKASVAATPATGRRSSTTTIVKPKKD